jgi:transporter family protein
MQGWFTPSIISLCSFGFWGLFSKLSVDYIDFKSAIIYQTIGVIVVAMIGLGMVDFRPATVSKGIWFAILTGLFYALGCLFYFVAASRGKIITVVTLTAFYPLVTILLSYFLLKEPITGKKIMGMVLASIAICLLAD